MGVKGVTDLMVAPGLVNLDFADIRTVMAEMGKAMMGTGEAEGEGRAIRAAELAISNPLLEDTCMRGAKGLLINITGGDDMTLFEVDAAANRIREEVDDEANIIFGSAIDDNLSGKVRVSVVATGIESAVKSAERPRLVAVTNGNLALADTDATAASPQADAIAAPDHGAPGPATGLAGGAPIPLRPATQGLSPAPVGLPPGIRPAPRPAAPAPLPAAAPRMAPAPVPFTESPPLAPRAPAPEAPMAEAAPAVARRVEPAASPRPASPAARPVQPAEARPAQAGGPNLFNRVTGLLRGRTAPATDARPAAAQPSFPTDQPTAAPAEMLAEAPRAAAPASGEKIDLEIPTFLRRQHSGTQH
jgi:cell division protein FtsZ